MFHVFHFLQTGMVFGIINPFLWILNAVYVSRDKNFPHFNALPANMHLTSRRFLAC